MKETLSKKQARFMYTIANLINWVNEDHGRKNGYIITFGDAFRDSRVHGQFGVKQGYGAAHSMHKLRLAVDINCIKNGALTAEFYPAMHDKWDELGGAERIQHDLNHFSFEHEGRR
jgi:hypothetical protein